MLDERKGKAKRMELNISDHGNPPGSKHPRAGFLNVPSTALQVVLQPDRIFEL